MKYSSQILIVLLLVFLSVACNDANDPSLPKSQVDLQMRATTSNGLLSGMASDGSLEFREILIGVSEIELELTDSYIDDDDSDDNSSDDDSDDDNDDSDDDSDDSDDDYDDDNDEIEFEGAFTVDLINGTSSPDFGVVSIEPGLYEEIEIEISPVMEDNLSVFISYSFEDLSGTIYDVEFSSSEDFEIEIEDEDGIDASVGSFQDILILLNVEQLFSQLDLNSAEVDGDGVIRINKSSNSNLYNQIVNRMDDVFEFED